jgi:DNA-directed RNA polymerase subunit RPC12/RpoP
MEPVLFWTVVCALATIGGMLATIWGIRRSTPTLSTQSQIQGSHRPKGRARLILCVTCGRKLLIRLSRGEAGVLDCPRCGGPLVVLLQDDGRISVGDASGRKLRYRARSYFFNCFWKISEMELRDGEDKDWESKKSLQWQG